MLKEILFISSLVLFVGIIEMDYTSTPAVLLDNGKTTTQEHEHCVITFLTDVLGDEFDIKGSDENTSVEE
jgi:hypothetical protein